MVLTQNIKKVTPSAEASAIASYDFYDLAAGRGIVTLYCGDVELSGAYSGQYTNLSPEYKMSNVKWYSINGVTENITGDYISLSFAMKLNRPMIIYGDCIVNVPISQYNQTGAGVKVSSYVVANLYHSGATSLTPIASGASYFAAQQISAGANKYHMHANTIDIPRTKLKIGDWLILNIMTSGAYYHSVAYDPYGRVDASEIPIRGAASWGTTTALTCMLPVVIDL